MYERWSRLVELPSDFLYHTKENLRWMWVDEDENDANALMLHQEPARMQDLWMGQRVGHGANRNWIREGVRLQYCRERLEQQ